MYLRFFFCPLTLTLNLHFTPGPQAAVRSLRLTLTVLLSIIARKNQENKDCDKTKYPSHHPSLGRSLLAVKQLLAPRKEETKLLFLLTSWSTRRLYQSNNVNGQINYHLWRCKSETLNTAVASPLRAILRRFYHTEKAETFWMSRTFPSLNDSWKWLSSITDRQA